MKEFALMLNFSFEEFGYSPQIDSIGFDLISVAPVYPKQDFPI